MVGLSGIGRVHFVCYLPSLAVVLSCFVILRTLIGGKSLDGAASELAGTKRPFLQFPVLPVQVERLGKRGSSSNDSPRSGPQQPLVPVPEHAPLHLPSGHHDAALEALRVSGRRAAITRDNPIPSIWASFPGNPEGAFEVLKRKNLRKTGRMARAWFERSHRGTQGDTTSQFLRVAALDQWRGLLVHQLYELVRTARERPAAFEARIDQARVRPIAYKPEGAPKDAPELWILWNREMSGGHLREMYEQAQRVDAERKARDRRAHQSRKMKRALEAPNDDPSLEGRAVDVRLRKRGNEAWPSRSSSRHQLGPTLETIPEDRPLEIAEPPRSVSRETERGNWWHKFLEHPTEAFDDLVNRRIGYGAPYGNHFSAYRNARAKVKQMPRREAYFKWLKKYGESEAQYDFESELYRNVLAAEADYPAWHRWATARDLSIWTIPDRHNPRRQVTILKSKDTPRSLFRAKMRQFHIDPLFELGYDGAHLHRPGNHAPDLPSPFAAATHDDATPPAPLHPSNRDSPLGPHHLIPSKQITPTTSSPPKKKAGWRSRKQRERAGSEASSSDAQGVGPSHAADSASGGRLQKRMDRGDDEPLGREGPPPRRGQGRGRGRGRNAEVEALQRLEEQRLFRAHIEEDVPLHVGGTVERLRRESEQRAESARVARMEHDATRERDPRRQQEENSRIVAHIVERPGRTFDALMRQTLERYPANHLWHRYQEQHPEHQGEPTRRAFMGMVNSGLREMHTTQAQMGPLYHLIGPVERGIPGFREELRRWARGQVEHATPISRAMWLAVDRRLRESAGTEPQQHQHSGGQHSLRKRETGVRPREHHDSDEEQPGAAHRPRLERRTGGRSGGLTGGRSQDDEARRQREREGRRRRKLKRENDQFVATVLEHPGFFFDELIQQHLGTPGVRNAWHRWQNAHPEPWPPRYPPAHRDFIHMLEGNQPELRTALGEMAPLYHLSTYDIPSVLSCEDLPRFSTPFSFCSDVSESGLN